MRLIGMVILFVLCALGAARAASPLSDAEAADVTAGLRACADALSGGGRAVFANWTPADGKSSTYTYASKHYFGTGRGGYVAVLGEQKKTNARTGKPVVTCGIEALVQSDPAAPDRQYIMNTMIPQTVFASAKPKRTTPLCWRIRMGGTRLYIMDNPRIGKRDAAGRLTRLRPGFLVHRKGEGICG